MMYSDVMPNQTTRPQWRSFETNRGTRISIDQVKPTPSPNQHPESKGHKEYVRVNSTHPFSINIRMCRKKEDEKCGYHVQKGFVCLANPKSSQFFSPCASLFSFKTHNRTGLPHNQQQLTRFEAVLKGYDDVFLPSGGRMELC